MKVDILKTSYDTS